MKTKLFIIGNGFDLHHGIESSYNHFKQYCKRNHEELYSLLESYYDEGLWSDFEVKLSEIETEYIINDYQSIFKEWNTSWRDMYRFNDSVTYETHKLRYLLIEVFNEWVRSLNKGNSSKRLFVDSNEYLYISFNYTDTLESLYRINESDIIYLHGKVGDENSDIIFGHNTSDDIIEQLMQSDNVLEQEAYDEVADYLKLLRKDTKQIIESNKFFFSSLADIDTVIVLGLSCSEVDLPYLNKIKESTKENAKWLVSYYRNREGDDDSNIIKENISKLELPYVKFFEISSFKNNFAIPSLF